MKFLFFIIFTLFVNLYSSAQNNIWMDENGNKTSKENATYYRPIPKKIKNGYWIIDYDKNGTLYKEGFSFNYNPKTENYNGLVITYHKNGKPQFKHNYKKGKLHGLYKMYYETGELKEQCRYKNGKQDGTWKTFYKTGKIKTKGKYRNGEKVGVWKTYYKNVYEGIVN